MLESGSQGDMVFRALTRSHHPSDQSAQWDKLVGPRRECSALTSPLTQVRKPFCSDGRSLTQPQPAPPPAHAVSTSRSLRSIQSEHIGHTNPAQLPRSPGPKSCRRCCHLSKHRNHTRPLIPPWTPRGSCRSRPEHSLWAERASRRLSFSGDAEDRWTHAPTPNTPKHTLICKGDTSDHPRLESYDLITVLVIYTLNEGELMLSSLAWLLLERDSSTTQDK